MKEFFCHTESKAQIMMLFHQLKFQRRIEYLFKHFATKVFNKNTAKCKSNLHTKGSVLLSIKIEKITVVACELPKIFTLFSYLIFRKSGKRSTSSVKIS